MPSPIIYWFWNKGFVEGTTGQSIAKRFLAFTTVDQSNNEPLGLGRGLLRALLVYLELVSIAVCGLGLILGFGQCGIPSVKFLLSDRTTGAVVFKA